MASLTIRNLDDSLKLALRRRAADHGRSMEEEARQILRQAMLRERFSGGMGSWIHSIARDVGGIELEIPPRTLPRKPPAFD